MEWRQHWKISHRPHLLSISACEPTLPWKHDMDCTRHSDIELQLSPSKRMMYVWISPGRKKYRTLIATIQNMSKSSRATKFELLTLKTLCWLHTILPFNEPSIDVVVRVRHRMSKKTCNTYLPHPCFLKSFIFVVATVRPIISNPPRAVTSPPALSSMKNVRLFTRWNFTNFKSIGSELSCRSNDVSLMVCSGSTSSTSYTKVCIKK